MASVGRIKGGLSKVIKATLPVLEGLRAA